MTEYDKLIILVFLYSQVRFYLSCILDANLLIMCYNLQVLFIQGLNVIGFILITSIIAYFTIILFKHSNNQFSDNTTKKTSQNDLYAEIRTNHLKDAEKNLKENLSSKSNNENFLIPKFNSPIVPDVSDKIEPIISKKINNTKKVQGISWGKMKDFFPSYKLYNTCLNELFFTSDEICVVIDKISKFTIYDNERILYAEDSILLKDLPMDISNIYTAMFQENIENAESLLFFKGQQYQANITWKRTTPAYSTATSYKISIKKTGYKDVDIMNITDFYIYEIDSAKKIKTIIYNSGFEKSITTNFDNIYTVIFNKNAEISSNQNLLLFKGNVLLHKIENINCGFSLCKKITPNGGLICQIFNTKDKHYEDVSTLFLNDNGNVDLLFNIKPKYEIMQDYLYSYDSNILNFNIIDKEGFINIYFYEKECLSFYILNEYTQQANSKEILSNKFDDDETVNYLVKYSLDRIKDILFIYFTIDCRYGADLAFCNGLYGKPLKNNLIAGTAVYNIPFLDYFRGLLGDFAYINCTSQIYLTKEQRNQYRYNVEKVYNNYNKKLDLNKLPIEFVENSISADIMLDKLEKFVKNCDTIKIDFVNKKVFDEEGNLILDYKKEKEDIVKELIKTNKYNKKWKSEVELYNLILKKFPNAIYQYHSKELGYQSFDIYIPDIKLAIEYQGLQHYCPVDIFGGVQGFEKRKILDENKRNLCRKNNIKLLEWKYTESINQLTLEKYLKELDIIEG